MIVCIAVERNVRYGNFQSLLGERKLMRLIDLVQRECVGDQIRNRKADLLCSPQEVKRRRVISQGVYPGSYKVDLLGAEIKVRIDRSVAVVDKESQLAETAAVADEMIDIAVCDRRTRALESKICKMSAESVLHGICQMVNALLLHEVDVIRSAQSL